MNKASISRRTTVLSREKEKNDVVKRKPVKGEDRSRPNSFGGVLFDSDFENVGGDESRKMSSSLSSKTSIFKHFDEARDMRTLVSCCPHFVW